MLRMQEMLARVQRQEEVKHLWKLDWGCVCVCLCARACACAHTHACCSDTKWGKRKSSRRYHQYKDRIIDEYRWGSQGRKLLGRMQKWESWGNIIEIKGCFVKLLLRMNCQKIEENTEREERILRMRELSVVPWCWGVLVWYVTIRLPRDTLSSD